MMKIISIALLIGGIILVVFGIDAINSFSSDFSRMFSGSPSEKSIYMLVSGIVVLIIGAGGMFYSFMRH
jgi:hypothetical protein